MWFFNKKREININNIIQVKLDENVFKELCVLSAQEKVDEVIKRLIIDYIKSKKHHQNEINIINQIDKNQTCSVKQDPKRIYIIDNQECDEDTFERNLVNKRVNVRRTITFQDGRICQNEWKVRNFSETSSLKFNLDTGPLRDWKRKGIVSIKLEI